jgi:hypothetical protein
MKDFYDLWMLAKSHEFDGHTLSEALRATFARRQTVIPEGVPLGLPEEFGVDQVKRVQWQAFVRKSGLAADGPKLVAILEAMRQFLLLPMEAAREGSPLALRWYPGGGWASRSDKD